MYWAHKLGLNFQKLITKIAVKNSQAKRRCGSYQQQKDNGKYKVCTFLTAAMSQHEKALTHKTISYSHTALPYSFKDGFLVEVLFEVNIRGHQYGLY